MTAHLPEAAFAFKAFLIQATFPAIVTILSAWTTLWLSMFHQTERADHWTSGFSGFFPATSSAISIKRSAREAHVWNVLNVPVFAFKMELRIEILATSSGLAISALSLIIEMCDSKWWFERSVIESTPVVVIVHLLMRSGVVEIFICKPPSATPRLQLLLEFSILILRHPELLLFIIDFLLQLLNLLAVFTILKVLFHLSFKLFFLKFTLGNFFVQIVVFLVKVIDFRFELLLA